MASKHWLFSPLSASLMSLLASRTHEWESWSIAEGGEGELSPTSVIWVEVELVVKGQRRVLRVLDLATATALEIFGALVEGAAAPGTVEAWQLAWQSDKFLSEFAVPPLAAGGLGAKWKLTRGSHLKPALWLLA